MPCAACLEGEYGIRDLFMGVPSKLGQGGIEHILEIKLTEQEQAEFEKSAGTVRGLVTVIEAQMPPWAELPC